MGQIRSDKLEEIDIEIAAIITRAQNEQENKCKKLLIVIWSIPQV